MARASDLAQLAETITELEAVPPAQHPRYPNVLSTTFRVQILRNKKVSITSGLSMRTMTLSIPKKVATVQLKGKKESH
jgi:hypothetical protein